MAPEVEVQVKGKPAERHEFSTALAWIGSNGGESLVPLAESTGGPVQLRFAPANDGIRVEVPEESTKWFVCEGSQARRMVVRWETEIYFGDARFAFLERATGSGSRGLFVIALLLLLAILAALAFRLLAPESIARREVEPPALAPEKAACPEPDPSAREARGRTLERAAEAKKERFPFDGSDGVEALVLLSEARACFASAGRGDDEARTQKALQDWTSRMNDEYAALRLRLRVALDHELVSDALRATKGLEALLSRQRGTPYAEWLRTLRHELERKAVRGA